MMKMIIKKLDGELFWGGRIKDCMPYEIGAGHLDGDTSYSHHNAGNQLCAMLLSNKGRVIFSNNPFDFDIREKEVEITAHKDLVMRIVGDNLRDAYLYAVNNLLKKPVKTPPKEFFEMPQFNTWVELIYNQNQKDILEYAHGIVDHGLPPGILMIDDNWQEQYGVWKFHEGRFPDPKAMMDELHALGFKVLLWVVPFVSLDNELSREMMEKKLLIRDADGVNTHVFKWWNGYSGILDLSNPETVEYFKRSLDFLMSEYGVDGFKFDAGQPFYYDTSLTYYKQPQTKVESSMHYCNFAAMYEYSELKDGFNAIHLPVLQRLGDKSHRWEEGVQTLIPGITAQAIMGYQFTCPDMIGGGSWVDFLPGKELDQELIVRYAQCCAFMPTMQFSVAPWRVLDNEKLGYVLDVIKLHDKYAGYIWELVEKFLETGEPVVRMLEYNYPNKGAKIKQQYMLGDKILVAPVVEKGVTELDVVLPEGKWLADDGQLYDGGKTVTVSAPLSRIPHFILQ